VLWSVCVHMVYSLKYFVFFVQVKVTLRLFPASTLCYFPMTAHIAECRVTELCVLDLFYVDSFSVTLCAKIYVAGSVPF